MTNVTAKRVRMLRFKKGLKQKELGELSNVSEAFISMIESNSKQPSRETVALLANALGVSSDYLLGLSNTEDLLPYSDTRKEFEPVIEIVEQLDEDKRIMVIKMIQSMVKSI
ncbi:helix-turn-helix domain-containing protein [Bacillus paranthracis]|uniref:helix-turn-helix domain-containing protein n=1 Tax=Bacillus paranthracis TaxID=2026186 RepID=UPI0029C4C3BC|nr:helix-turn-helix transcriptional regulator [Bacillus paranthracis]MDX6046773.1 helix-turn-helix transcriptional regulator [Bacillus paranthracis]